MALSTSQILALESVSRDLDLIVYRLECSHSSKDEGWKIERAKLRRDLEKLQDELQETLRAIES